MENSQTSPPTQGDWDPVLGPSRVFLVGAGPGDPGLITLRGKEVLEKADAVLYDRLICPDLLTYCKPGCQTICVSELPGTHPEKWPEICRFLVELGKQGRVVVRLKGGDPFLFGRGAEECEALLEAGIPFEVVPGVSSGLAAPTYAGISLTHRQMASAVALVTAHEIPNKSNLLDVEALIKFPGTLVFFMPLKQMAHWQSHLLEKGKSPETPVALIQKGTWNEQKVKVTQLSQVLEVSKEFHSPTLLVVGEVVSLHSRLDWVGRRPLSGKKILLTRPAGQAKATIDMFRRWGAVCENEPVIDLEPIDPNPQLERAIETLVPKQWVVFASQTGVQRFFQVLLQMGKDARHLGGVKLACIGPATQEALRPFHLKADLVAQEHTSEGLAKALLQESGVSRVLLIRADRGRKVLQEELSQRFLVETVAVYQQKDISSWPQSRVEQLQMGAWQWIVVGSSSIARGLGKILAEYKDTLARMPMLAAISPITAGVLSEVGLKADVVATEATMAGVLKSILQKTQDS